MTLPLTRFASLTQLIFRPYKTTGSPKFLNPRAFSSIKNKMTPLIALEEHFVDETVVQQTVEAELYAHFPPYFMKKLKSMDTERIQDLDKGNVALQVLSHGPTNSPPDICVEANNTLAKNISKNPTRLAGFAMLPMAHPEAAAEELSRCVKDLGFVGALIENHIDGEFYDAKKFWVMFEKAVELDVPIYIHPTFASDDMMTNYRGNYGEDVAVALSSHGWGWHTETGLHFLRLFASGLFDHVPKLKLVIGHMGEMLPFQLDRIFGQSERWGKRERGLRQVWKENVWVTTSGMFSLAPFGCLVKMCDASHVLFSVDYPFSTNEKGREFFEEVRASGILSSDEMESFGYGNAEKLLKVKLQPGGRKL